MLSVVCVFLFTTSAYAFQDIKGDPAEQSILSLKEAGIVSGVDANHYDPKGKLSFAQAVYLITKGLELNINHIKFVKQPLASDYFTSVSDSAWYADSLVIAHLNGLPLGKDLNPDQIITREQFADLLKHAIEKKGEFPLIEIYIDIADMDEVQIAYKDSVQALTIMNIIRLDDKQKFLPKQEVTRAQAAMWVHAAREFVKTHTDNTTPDEQLMPDKDVAVLVEKHTSEVSKVTVSWGEQSNSGYGIIIKGIEFKNNKEAIISYELSYPEPGMHYLMVLTHPKAVTYIPSQYKPVLKPYAAKLR